MSAHLAHLMACAVQLLETECFNFRRQVWKIDDLISLGEIRTKNPG